MTDRNVRQKRQIKRTINKNPELHPQKSMVIVSTNSQQPAIIDRYECPWTIVGSRLEDHRKTQDLKNPCGTRITCEDESPRDLVGCLAGIRNSKDTIRSSGAPTGARSQDQTWGFHGAKLSGVSCCCECKPKSWIWLVRCTSLLALLYLRGFGLRRFRNDSGTATSFFKSKKGGRYNCDRLRLCEYPALLFSDELR